MFSCIIQTKCAQIKRGDPQEMGIWGEMAGAKDGVSEGGRTPWCARGEAEEALWC